MRRLLCTALLLLCCAYGCIAAVVQPLPQKGQGPWDTYIVSAPKGSIDKSGKNWQPIRFAVSAKEIDRVLKYCEQWKKDPWAKDIYDEDYGFILEVAKHKDEFCYEEEKTKMTDVKKSTLLRKVLPAALKLHSERLSVDRVEKLELPFNKTEKEYPVLPLCTNVSIPKEHQQGISNADFMLYVGVTTSADSTNSVKICSKNTEGRPTSALIKFIPIEIDATRYFIRFTAHEVAHALGFEIEMMKKYMEIKEEKTGKKEVQLVASNALIDKMKEQYKCPSDEGNAEIKGMPLQSKASQTNPPHWKGLIAKDELMSPYTSEPGVKDVNGAYYTSLTLAVFDSMPFYKADFNMAESMSWGKNVGCDFLKGEEQMKSGIIDNNTEMFCKEVKSSLQCTSDRFSLGMCSKDPGKGVQIPDEYFSLFTPILKDTDDDLMDGYPIIKPFITTSCEEGTVEYMPGSIVSNISRCLKGVGLQLREQNVKKKHLLVGDICADVKCDDNKVHIRYKGNDSWHVCNEENSVITPAKDSAFSSGTIQCPKYSEVCNEKKKSTEFTIVYDEGEEEKLKREEEQEKDEMEVEAQEAETDQKKKEQEAKNKMEEDNHKMEEKEQLVEERSQVNTNSQQVPPLPADGKMKENQSKPAEQSALDTSGKQSPAPSNAGNQGDSAGVGQEDVSLPASPEPRAANEENRAQDSNINNSSGALPQEPSIPAPKGPNSEASKEVSSETTETPKPVKTEPNAVSEQTSTIKDEDKKNKTENIEQVQETITQSQPQNGNDEGINTTVDTTLDPNSPATDNEKEGGVNADNNTTNTTTSIPENVSASAVPATLTELNKTQMGQVINQVG
ncbi:surface protease GP63, partial [Trypanosoma theileri]